MSKQLNDFWEWNGWNISWSSSKPSKHESKTNILLIHGFGASKKHWRNNQKILGEHFNCYSIDLLGFGESSQPSALLDYESPNGNNVKYCFDLWGKQIEDFSKEIISSPVFLIGNSIGGIVSLKSAQLLGKMCAGVILIDCAQRTMDDKRLKQKDVLMSLLRPIIKTLVRQRFISKTLFSRAANPKIIRKILTQAYPSGQNLDDELIEILYKPSLREHSAEAFRGFINLFNDYLATDLFDSVSNDIHLIWGEKDPWESLKEAEEWKRKYKKIKSLDVIKGAGHCPHDEYPEITNNLILKIIQETK
tara:strand:- start:3209 stop:4123 length:915 start_codon:yes stop_codon:yes gene_type:complete